jgi:lipopolysaccharide biosynthesis glycosyltransferase
MDILLGFDNNYVMPSGVLIYSILHVLKNSDITFHILHKNLSENNQNQLRKIINCKNHVIRFYTINNDFLKRQDLPELGNMSIATYYKFLSPYILPESLSKVLFLDSDMIAVDSLEPLWNMDIFNYYIGASIDASYDNICYYNRLGLKIHSGYFNCGMLLINLDLWRKDNISNKLFSFLKINKEKCRFHDQDAVNFVLGEYSNGIKKTPCRFNAMFYGETLNTLMVRNDYFSEIKDASANPAIIHFVGTKPWYKECQNPCKEIWCYIKNQTSWKNEPEKHMKRTFKAYLKNWITSLLMHKEKTIKHDFLPDLETIYNRLNSY